MSTDLVARLRQALDEAEETAKRSCYGLSLHPAPSWRAELLTDAAAGERWHVLNGAQIVARCPEVSPRFAPHIARWSPAEVLRLVDHFRRVVMAHVDAEASLVDKMTAFSRDEVGSGELIAATARAKAAREGVERAAEFWLEAT